MSKNVIPGPGIMALGPMAGFDTVGLISTQIPFTEPGDVADPSGDLWLDLFGDRLAYGEMTVTPEQAQAAAHHGWEVVLGSEREGKVVVRRPDPHPEET
jgi:hypothetical protein